MDETAGLTKVVARSTRPQTLQAQVGDLEDRLNEEEDGRKELEAALAEKKQQIADLEKKLEGDVLGKAKELEISERRLRAQLEEVQLKLDEVGGRFCLLRMKPKWH